MELNQPAGSTSIKVKTPKRILHFSDGTLEEYSDDEVEASGSTECKQEPAIDPKTLTWGPWMSYMMWAAGSSTLSACDYVGETLASAFGITTPKYYFEIEECKRIQQENKRAEEQRLGWCETSQAGETLVTKECGISTASNSATHTSIPRGASASNTAVGDVADA